MKGFGRLILIGSIFLACIQAASVTMDRKIEKESEVVGEFILLDMSEHNSVRVYTNMVIDKRGMDTLMKAIDSIEVDSSRYIHKGEYVVKKKVNN